MSYYDRQDKPMDRDAWSRTFADAEYKRVAETTIGSAYVSTVWLGLDHQHGDGPPLIFETMVFGGEHDEYCDRYSTEAAGHIATATRPRPQRWPATSSSSQRSKTGSRMTHPYASEEQT